MARALSSMEKIAPGIFRSSAKCVYIQLPNGDVKFCSQERFEKLLHRHNGDHAAIVAQYRTRHTGATPPETKEQRIARLEKELLELKGSAAPTPAPETEVDDEEEDPTEGEQG